MPSVAQKQSQAALAVQNKHKELQHKFSESAEATEHVHRLALQQLVPTIAERFELHDEGIARLRAFLDDQAALFRFYRRSRYDTEQAISLLDASLSWRIKTDLDLLSLASLHPLYVNPPAPNPPLFWANSSFRDRFGRPCGVINLRSVERTEQNTLDELKEYIVACMEILRRYIAELNTRARRDKHNAASTESPSAVLQSVIAVDLAGSGMANLELELLPFLLDLLKNHFPGMVGAVYILHYGWVHAGMWAVAKRVLPEQALARIFFPSHTELQEHFDLDKIPRAYDGGLDVEMNAASNDVLRKWGKPRRGPSSAYFSPLASPDITRNPRALSRTSSYESMYEVFYSAAGTPWASRPITPRHSGPPTPRGDQSPRNTGLRMTPNAARKLRRLQMTRGESLSRQRSASDLRHDDPAAAGLTVNTAGLSPVATPLSGRSPAMRGRRPGEARHVHFGTSGSRRSLSPVRRVGTSRSFTLPAPQEDDDRLPSESESEASGKDGAQAPTSPHTEVTEAGQGSLLSRWRRGRRFSFPTGFRGAARGDDDAEGEAEAEYVGSITYIDPGSPQLQVPHLGEPPISRSVVPQHRFLSQRSRKYDAKAGHVSPYNATNPFFGYPAYVSAPSQAVASSDTGHRFSLGLNGTPQHLHARRRKRDLMRTLTYLFVLRLLALHREIRWKALVIWKEASRTMRIAGEDQTDGDRLWRLAEERERARKTSAKGPETAAATATRSRLRSKALLAFFLLAVLKPSWRKLVLAQVAALTASLRAITFKTHGSQTPSPLARPSLSVRQVRIADPAVAANIHVRSWTGLHIREKLGIRTSSAGNAGGRNNRSRNGALALAGGALALASLGVYLYSQMSKQGGHSDGNDDDDDVGRRDSGPSKQSGAADAAAKNTKRPTMSLCLSASFDRSVAASMDGLRTLLLALSPCFLIHLILPSQANESRRSDFDQEESLNAFVESLGPVPGLDTRRILEYSRNSGRWAIPRALACDCHVEILFRSTSPVASVVEDAGGALAELDKIRRSSGLVVVAAISAKDGEMQCPEIDAVFAGLRQRAVEQGGGSRQADAPAGMRAFDQREEGPQGWATVGERVQQLRGSWR